MTGTPPAPHKHPQPQQAEYVQQRSDDFHYHGAGGAHHHHAHEPRPAQRHALLIALLLTGGFALVEVAGGLFANSLALSSDAGHMAADAGALLIALVAARLAARPDRKSVV